MVAVVFDNITVQSGDPAPESGHYLYKKNAVRGELPCIPESGEKVITLSRGDPVPFVKSCNDHAAVYRLMIITDK